MQKKMSVLFCLFHKFLRDYYISQMYDLVKVCFEHPNFDVDKCEDFVRK